MITPEDLLNWFTYHSPTAEQRDKYLRIRDAAHAFATVIVANTPSCPDQTVAIRKVREATMVANQAIACDGK
jgi:hypothetical protein